MLVRRFSKRTVAGVCGVAGLAVTMWAVTLAAASGLADAARSGDREAVRALLKQGADVNEAAGDGVTALHWAARRGDAELASLLLVAGANPGAATRTGRYTALHLAAERGSAPVVKALIAAGANASAATSTGATPLMFAASVGDTATLSAIIDGGADVNAAEAARGQTALMWAAAANRPDAVKLLIARGADPNKATTVIDFAALSRDGANPDGRNLPTQAAGRSTTPTTAQGSARAESPAARRVAMPGVDRNYLINELVHAQGGFAPLHYAAREGHLDVANALLTAGVNVNTRALGDGSTALLVATVNGQAAARAGRRSEYRG
jgi:ankyrin repeat protein